MPQLCIFMLVCSTAVGIIAIHANPAPNFEHGDSFRVKRQDAGPQPDESTAAATVAGNEPQNSSAKPNDAGTDDKQQAGGPLGDLQAKKGAELSKNHYPDGIPEFLKSHILQGIKDLSMGIMNFYREKKAVNDAK